MHYYQHHIGDFIRDTSRLNDSQCMAYLRLLWIYYESERPLPDDPAMLAMRIGSDPDTVRMILSAFFTPSESESGRIWNQIRCESEIRKFQKKAESARSANATRWSDSRLKSETKSDLKSDVKSDASQILTNNQEPITNKSNPLSGKPDAAPTNNRELFAQAVGVLEFLNEKTGRHYRPVKANITPLMCRFKEGFTATTARQVIAKKCREWGRDDKMEPYLRPATLFNATNFANYAGEIAPAERQ